jgi:alpha-tubulin suppressor-like RCC1 family protein
MIKSGTHTAAIKTDGTLWTWGYNLTGQLGDGTTLDRSSPITTVAGGTNWSQVAAGQYITGAIKTDGTLWTWGYDNYGQLGDGTVVNRSSPITTAGGGTNWSKISSTSRSFAAIKTDGTLWIWGQNSSGSLGDGTIINRSSPVTVAGGGTTWSQVACGYFIVAAVKTDGTLWSWGDNSYGALGDGTVVNKSSPISITSNSKWSQIASGPRNFISLKADGTLWSWGNNSSGQLGDGTTINKSSPVTIVGGITSWSSLPSGTGVHGGMLAASPIQAPTTILYQWGRDDYGQLGQGTTSGGRSSPATAPTFTYGWTQFSQGSFYYAAIVASGALYTCGYNVHGELGDGTTINRSSPITTIGGGTTWKQVASGNNQTAAVKTDGTLWTWGYNVFGQLGDGTTLNRSSPVTTAAGGTTWSQVEFNATGFTAVKTNGTLWTCGYNSAGHLGDGTTLNRSSPVTTAGGGTNWSLAVGAGGIKTDGTLWTWGGNGYGQLGDGTTLNRSSPVTTVAGGTNWKKVKGAGSALVTGLKTDGTLWGWGFNVVGYVGDGTTLNRSSPVTTAGGGTTWSDIGLNLAIKTDGTLWIWGYNSQGNLGDGTTINRSSPVTVAGGITGWTSIETGHIGGSGISAAFVSFTATYTIIPSVTIVNTGSNIQWWISTTNVPNGTVLTYSNSGTALASAFTDGLSGGTITIVNNFATINKTIANSGSGSIAMQLTTFGAVASAATVTIVSSSASSSTYAIYPSVDTTPEGSTVYWYISTTNVPDGTTLYYTNSGTLNAASVGTNSGITRLSDGLNYGSVTITGNFGLINKSIANNLQTDGTTSIDLQLRTASTAGTIVSTASSITVTDTSKTTINNLYVWGKNDYGQFGNGTTLNRSSPITVAGGGTAWSQSVISDYNGVGIKQNGTLWTQGYNLYGNLGDGTTVDKSSPVTTAGGGTTWSQVSCGYMGSAATKTDGTLWTCGYNRNGQLGDGTTLNRSSPVTTAGGGTTWKQVAAGYNYTAAVKTDGTLWTWGQNGFGQLGSGTTIYRSSPATTAGGGTTWKQVAAGQINAGAIKTDGTLWTWGYNTYGQVGDGTTLDRSSPATTVAGGTTWSQVSVGYNTLATIKTDGTLWTWGYNFYGQLGSGTTIDRSSPATTVAGGTTWKQVAIGSFVAGAVKTDGTLWTWGYNPYGALGDGTTLNRSSPITILGGITNWYSAGIGATGIGVAAITTATF